VDGEHGGDRLVEGRNAGGAARGRARVAAGTGDSAVGEGAFAGLGQGHEGEAAEAERAGLVSLSRFGDGIDQSVVAPLVASGMRYAGSTERDLVTGIAANDNPAGTGMDPCSRLWSLG